MSNYLIKKLGGYTVEEYNSLIVTINQQNDVINSLKSDWFVEVSDLKEQIAILEANQFILPEVKPMDEDKKESLEQRLKRNKALQAMWKTQSTIGKGGSVQRENALAKLEKEQRELELELGI